MKLPVHAGTCCAASGSQSTVSPAVQIAAEMCLFFRPAHCPPWPRRGDSHPPRKKAPFPWEENQRLTALYRQAALLADLLTESLEEILNRIDGLEYKEGQSAFARRYRGKAVVFYATVRQDAAGRHQMDYRLLGPRRKAARLELADLKLLHALPLQEPQLLLFGARLDKVSRDPAGAWAFSLEPESGILITHPGAAAACCF